MYDSLKKFILDNIEPLDEFHYEELFRLTVARRNTYSYYTIDLSTSENQDYPIRKITIYYLYNADLKFSNYELKAIVVQISQNTQQKTFHQFDISKDNELKSLLNEAKISHEIAHKSFANRRIFAQDWDNLSNYSTATHNFYSSTHKIIAEKASKNINSNIRKIHLYAFGTGTGEDLNATVTRLKDSHPHAEITGFGYDLSKENIKICQDKFDKQYTFKQMDLSEINHLIKKIQENSAIPDTFVAVIGSGFFTSNILNDSLIATQILIAIYRFVDLVIASGLRPILFTQKIAKKIGWQTELTTELVDNEDSTNKNDESSSRCFYVLKKPAFIPVPNIKNGQLDLSFNGNPYEAVKNMSENARNQVIVLNVAFTGMLSPYSNDSQTTNFINQFKNLTQIVVDWSEREFAKTILVKNHIKINLVTKSYLLHLHFGGLSHQYNEVFWLPDSLKRVSNIPALENIDDFFTFFEENKAYPLSFLQDNIPKFEELTRNALNDNVHAMFFLAIAFEYSQYCNGWPYNNTSLSIIFWRMLKAAGYDFGNHLAYLEKNHIYFVSEVDTTNNLIYSAIWKILSEHPNSNKTLITVKTISSNVTNIIQNHPLWQQSTPTDMKVLFDQSLTKLINISKALSLIEKFKVYPKKFGIMISAVFDYIPDEILKEHGITCEDFKITRKKTNDYEVHIFIKPEYIAEYLKQSTSNPSLQMKFG